MENFSFQQQASNFRVHSKVRAGATCNDYGARCGASMGFDKKSCRLWKSDACKDCRDNKCWPWDSCCTKQV